MENRSWEEELAGRWYEISALVADGAQAEKIGINDQRSVIKETDWRAKEPGTKN